MLKAALVLASVTSTTSEAGYHDVSFWTDAYGYCKPVRSPVARTITLRCAHTPSDHSPDPRLQRVCS